MVLSGSGGWSLAIVRPAARARGGRRSLRRWRGRRSGRRRRRRRRGRRGRPAGRRRARGARGRRGRRGGRPAPSAANAASQRPARTATAVPSPTMLASVPSATTRPAAMSTRRSHSPASSRWWVVTSTPAPPAAARWMVSHSAARAPRPTPDVGSSRTSRSGCVGQGRGEREAPAQPERQVPHERRRGAGEVGLQLRRRGAERLGGEGEVLGHGQVLPEARDPGGRSRGVRASPVRAAGRTAGRCPDGRVEEAEQQPDEGGLAGAVGAEQPDHLAGAHLEVHAGDRRERPEAAHRAFGQREARRACGRRGRLHCRRCRPIRPAAASASARPARAARRRRPACGRPRGAHDRGPVWPRRGRWWRRPRRPRRRRPRRSAATGRPG